MLECLKNLNKETVERIKTKLLIKLGYSMICPNCGILAKELNGIVFKVSLNERKGIGICSTCLSNPDSLDENKIIKNIKDNFNAFHLGEDDLVNVTCAINNFKKGLKLVAALA